MKTDWKYIIEKYSVAAIIAMMIVILYSFFQGSMGVYFAKEVLPTFAKSVAEQIAVINWLGKKDDMELYGADNLISEEQRLLLGQALPEMSKNTLAVLEDFELTKQVYFAVPSTTTLTERKLNVKEALLYDFTITPTLDEPKILLFHTHANEYFRDSDMSLGLEEGIVGTAEILIRILENEYGISVLHCKEQFDVVDGEGRRTGAYERMEEPIRTILAENPSIEMTIDLHRDGVADNVHLVTEIGEKNYAQLMFVNGVTTLLQDGLAVPATNLENPYIQENLAMSLQLQLIAESRFDNLMRKIYLNPYRLSTHMMPRALLIEVGAQTNTKEEAANSMVLLARMLADVLLAEEEVAE
ncbi:MAG: stage II sporulation protein P [Bacillota bacterium]